MREHIRKEARKDVPDIRERIKAEPSYRTFIQKARQKEPRRGFFGKLRLATAGTFAVLLLLLFLALPAGREDHTEIFIEINPSFTLLLNEDDEVEAFIPGNSDAEILFEAAGSPVGMMFEDAIDMLFDKGVELNFIREGESFILYDAISADKALEDRHLEMLEHRLASLIVEKARNVQMARGLGGSPTEKELEVTEDYGINLMRARLIGNILTQEEDIEIEDLLDKSIRELLDKIDGHHRAGPPAGEDDYPSRHPFDNDNLPPNMPGRNPMR